MTDEWDDPENGAGQGTPTKTERRTRAPKADPKEAVDKPRTVVERLIAVMADVPDLPKDSQAPANMGGYAFRGIESITTALRPLMAKHGVLCLAKVRKRIESERQVGNNKTMYVVDLHIHWTFYGADGDTLEADSWGCGTDMGDKATQKSVTAAFKSLLTPTFFIGDGASDSERHSVAETSGGQRRQRGTRNQASPPPDPEQWQWFHENGWLDRAQAEEARKVIIDTAASMPQQAKDVFKGWCANHEPPVDLTRGWSAPLVEEMRTYLTELAKLYQPPAPQPPATAPAEPSPTTAECVWCHKSVAIAAAVRGQAEGHYHEACAEEEATETAPPT